MAYTFLDLAYDVLRKARAPLTYQEIWHAAQEYQLAEKVGTKGKTPWASLGAQLYVDVLENASSRFVKVGHRPARFYLQELAAASPATLATRLEQAQETRTSQTPPYKERDLHPVLAYFAFAAPAFNRGRAIFTKTILHEKSKKNRYSEWSHPDLVGFSIPLDDWSPEVLAFNELIDRDALTLFSFEVKRQLTRATYREAFFQAVSNSSWAHQGYLVAAEIDEDDDLLAELERLASSFGIGIIHLHLADFGESRVVYPARAKDRLDWETINKLCEQNQDFAEFLRSVKIDVQARKIHRAEYDEILPDIDAHLRNLLAK